MGDIGISKKNWGKWMVSGRTSGKLSEKKNHDVPWLALRQEKWAEKTWSAGYGAPTGLLDLMPGLRWGWLVVEVWRCSRIDLFFLLENMKRGHCTYI